VNIPKDKSSSKHILKWILFLPIGIAIYKLSNILITFLVYPFYKEFVMAIIYSRDFGEYTIIGPLFIFIREVFNITLATYFGIYFVPKHKKTTFIVISIIWLLILIVTTTTTLIAYSNYEFTLEKLYRTFTEMSAQIIGFIISGVYIWRNQNKKKTFVPNKKELINQADIVRRQIFDAFPDFLNYPSLINKNYSDLVSYCQNIKSLKKYNTNRGFKNEQEIVLVIYHFAFANLLKNIQDLNSEYRTQPRILVDWTRNKLNEIGFTLT
jgi:hypothetical protein